MEPKKTAKIITGQLLSIRRLLKEGESLSPAEYERLKSDIQALLLDLESKDPRKTIAN